METARICLDPAGIGEDAVLAAIVRITGRNFRLLHRLLTQVARALEIIALQTVPFIWWTPPARAW